MLKILQIMRKQMLATDKQSRIIQCMLGLLIVINVILSFQVFKYDKKLVVMVPTIDRKMIVGTTIVSQDYLLYRAEQIMQLLFNIRHERYEDNVSQILSQVSSSQKPQFQQQLTELVKDIKDKKYFYVFNKESQKVDEKRLSITFRGYLETYINNKRQDNIEFKIYKLSFVNHAGMVSLVSFIEIKDKQGVEQNEKENREKSPREGDL